MNAEVVPDDWNAARFVAETAKLIRKPPDVSDAGSRLRGLTTCRWTHPAHESVVPAMKVHFVAYHFGPRSHVGFRFDGARPDAVWCEPGTCSYVPAHLPVQWNLLTRMNVINILIPDALVEEAHAYVRDEKVRVAARDPQVGFESRRLERLAVLMLRRARAEEEQVTLSTEELTQQICLTILLPVERARQLPKGIARLTPAQTRRTIDRIRASLSAQCGLPSLSSAAGVSVFQFAHAFRNTVGVSPHEYVSRLRASQARLMLTQTSCCMAEIGESIGFSSAAGFTNFFHRRTGVSPTAYRAAFTRKRKP